jgi:hypothetical protein
MILERQYLCGPSEHSCTRVERITVGRLSGNGFRIRVTLENNLLDGAARVAESPYSTDPGINWEPTA